MPIIQTVLGYTDEMRDLLDSLVTVQGHIENGRYIDLDKYQRERTELVKKIVEQYLHETL